MNQFYQGDISILSGQAFEKASKKLKFSPLPKGGLVIAEGESTGHRHLLVLDRPQTKVEFAKDANGYFIKISGGNAILQHTEHKEQTIQPGLYWFGRQWEWNEIDERKVTD